MLFNDNLNINSAEYVRMKKAINTLIRKHDAIENYQSEINYLLMELVILSHLAYYLLQTWCYLPSNM